MIWPWSRFRQDEQRIKGLVDDILAASAREMGLNQRIEQLGDYKKRYRKAADMVNEQAAHVTEQRHRAEIAEVNLRNAERELERERAEHHLVKQDFQHLVAQAAGRLPAKQPPFDFNRDPFVEDPKIPDTWLSDADSVSDLPEELLDSGEAEDGISRGPESGPGAEGAP